MYPCASRAQYSITHMFMLSCVSQVTIYPRSRGRGLQLAGTEGGRRSQPCVLMAQWPADLESRPPGWAVLDRC